MTPLQSAILAELDGGRCVHIDDLVLRSAESSGEPRSCVPFAVGALICLGEVEQDGRGMVRRKTKETR